MSDNILNNDSGVVKPVIPDVPTINPNSPLPPFKAWVQMAIPTVYDESLSYAELLYKVINYLNVTNDHLTNNDTIINELSTYMGEEVTIIQNWFKNLNVDDEVDKKVQEVLDLWASPYDPETPNSGKLYSMFIDDVQSQVATGLDSWIGEHIDPITGYVIDDSLTLKTGAPPASMLGTSLNNIGNVAFNEILNMRLGNDGIGYVTEDNSMIYRYLLINQGYNKIIIYPNNLENFYLRYVIKSAKSGSSSAVITTGRYPSSGYGTLSEPIEVDFTPYKNNGDIYFECSITKQTGTLPINTNKASVAFRYADSMLDSMIKNETEDKITENDLNNAIVNTGFISFSDEVQSGRLHATDGTKVNDENSLLYGYAGLSENYSNIVVWAKEPALYIRVAFYSVSGNNQSFIRNTRINVTDKPTVIPYDYSNDEKFMRISVTCEHTLDPTTDGDILTVANADNAYYEQNEFYLKNYNEAIEYSITEGYVIGTSGTPTASSTFNYKTLNVKPFTNYLFIMNPNTSITQTLRIHGYYNDGTNETWIQQLLAFAGNTYTEPFVINSQSSNVIKVSMPNTATGFEFYEINNFILSGDKTLEYKALSSYVYSGAKVSILGASISSYEGTIPEGFTAYYPRETQSQSQNPVKSINDMYWKKFIDIIGGELLVNNSSAGRTCSMGVEVQRPRAACGTWCTELHSGDIEPDIIIIQVGGNDFANDVALGDYVGTTDLPTDDSGDANPVITSIFSNAYAIMLAKILTRYPKAKVICGTIPPIRAGEHLENDSFPIKRTSDNVTLTAFNERIRTLARAFGCYIAEFYGNGRTQQNIRDYCQDDVQHPSREGQSLMCNALLNTLGQQNLNYFNV